MTARFSVVIATYNQGPYLAEALDSILAQKGPSLEIIVVDDASTDNTAQVLAPYLSRIKLIRLERNNGGPARPRNIAMKAATGELIAIFDGDDVMQPGKLAEAAAFFDANSGVSFSFTNFRNFSAEGPGKNDFLADHAEFHAMDKRKVGDGWFVIPRSAAYETLIGDNFIGTSGVVFRRELLADIGFFDEALKRSEDIEYWYRIALRFDMGYIDRVGHLRRLHGTNISAGQAPLRAKIAIYRRQDPRRMSPAARRSMDVMLGRLYYSIGFMDLQQGRRWSAIANYARSLTHFFNGGRAILSIIAALFSSSSRRQAAS